MRNAALATSCKRINTFFLIYIFYLISNNERIVINLYITTISELQSALYQSQCSLHINISVGHKKSYNGRQQINFMKNSNHEVSETPTPKMT